MPLIRVNMPAFVVQVSPSTGEVGTVPSGTRNPAPAVIEAAERRNPCPFKPWEAGALLIATFDPSCLMLECSGGSIILAYVSSCGITYSNDGRR